MVHQVIISAFETVEDDIPSATEPLIHQLVNARNGMEMQVDRSLAYLVKNMLISPGISELLMKVHILIIPDPYLPNNLSPLLTPLMLRVLSDAS